MAQFYTLEEAATRLQIGPDELRRRLKTEWTSIRPFRDGATLRFRAADIDELARSLGAASDTGLPLGPVGSPAAEESGDYAALPAEKPSSARKPADEPLGLGGGEDITISPDSGLKAKPKGDSDVRIDPSRPPQTGSDPESHLPTEEIALDLSGGPPSGTLKSPSSGKLSAPKSPKPDSGKISQPPARKEGSDSSSEFELSLDSDSDSFELQLTTDSSEEVDIGSPPDGTDVKSGHSGINLGKPSDSGVSLEKKGPKSDPKAKGKKAETDSDSDVDFELSLDPSGSSAARMGGPKSGPPKSGPPKSGPPKSGAKKPPQAEESSSEFELTLDDSSGVSERLADNLRADEGKGDIFETDFELPVMPDESGSEVVPVESADTDLDNTGFDVDAADDVPVDDESASEVVMVDEDSPLIDEEAVALDDEALAPDEASASQVLRGVRDGEPGEVRTVVAAPPKWGPIPAVGLALTLIPAFLGMLMTFEILRGMWGYSPGGGAGGLIVRGVADAFGMKVND